MLAEYIYRDNEMLYTPGRMMDTPYISMVMEPVYTLTERPMELIFAVLMED